MCLLTDTEQLIAGKAAGRKAATYRENIKGVGIPLVGGSHRSHWQVFDSSEASRVAATCCSAAINGRNVPIIQVWGVRTGRKRAAVDTTQPAIPLGSITTGWACQISIAPLFQTIAMGTKVPRPRGTFQGTSMVWKSAAIEIYGGGHLRKRATKIPSYFVRRLG